MKKIRAILFGEQAMVEITEARCNICGSDCMKGTGDARDFEGLEISANWGYFSAKDGEKWRAVICEECTDKYLKPVIKFDIL